MAEKPMKSEPMEIESRPAAIGTPTTSIPRSNSIKRSRKSAHPSKTIQTPSEHLFINCSTNTSCLNQIDESITNTIDDETSNIPTANTPDEEDVITSGDEESTVAYRNVTSKRPRLTYDKRLEANARERERVHNLTAAFEALRQVIPMYGDQPKLSRLSILRIACSYVLVLGALNEIDFSEGQNAYTFNECFHMLSSTILNELRRKKSNNQLNRND
ncbi:unnamed protein product [Adineta ricciae]|uniref:BHLH domain-containing protein n=1 Tax=Adineta ricciae TaxID=249248 RepID=A0A813YSK3_ADIRI|nr:unnamed protein product [Adineta ricciae]CAF1291875.1 unnamed protein product [Adineta ricciae]